MPLPLPHLDRRTFAELVAEGRSLLALTAPSWTDHNASDPGITMLELFAAIVESASYRLDRTPAAAYCSFLRLVGVEPRPARVAETVLSLRLSGGGTAAATLPAGLQVQDASGTLGFQTAAAVAVSPARLEALRGGREDASADLLAANDTGGGYHPFGQAPAPGACLYLGFDRPLSDAPVALRLFVWTGGADVDSELRARLAAEWSAARNELVCPPGVAPDLPDWRLHYSARTAWEYLAGPGDWRPLPEVVDETRGLTLSGFVGFTAPLDHVAGGPDPARFFLRCRYAAGSYACPPFVARVVVNAVPARHAVDVSEEELGTSTGGAGQRVNLSHRSVVAGSTRLRVDPDGGATTSWTEVLDWDHSGPHDRHYRLAPVEGELSFGDGLTGRVPPAGAVLHASYQVGGGSAGNVPAGTLDRWRPDSRNPTLVPDWSTLAPTLAVAQPVPGAGGADAESLEEAQGRALSALATPDRAVTLEDFELLALATPGVPVARARALAEHHPDLPCVPAHGCVTVVVVPACPESQPVPGPDLLRAVERHLARRRSLTTELHIIGPRFTTVTVSARLWSTPSVRPVELAAAAREALDRFFHPLRGGPTGGGWPIGRDVYRAEVQACLSAVPGVVAVDQLSLRLEGDPEPRCDNLPVCPDALLTSGDHHVEVVERSTP